MKEYLKVQIQKNSIQKKNKYLRVKKLIMTKKYSYYYSIYNLKLKIRKISIYLYIIQMMIRMKADNITKLTYYTKRYLVSKYDPKERAIPQLLHILSDPT